MSPNESLFSDDWVRIAEKDFQRAEKLLAENDPELAGFCLQQAVEKFFKAFLLAQGWQLRRIHDLNSLLDDALLYEPTLEDYRPICQKISAFYFFVRYPLMTASGLESSDLQNTLPEAKELIGKLRAGVYK